MACKYNMPILGYATLKRMVGFKGLERLPSTHHEFMLAGPCADIYVLEAIQVEILSCGHWIEPPQEPADGRDCPRCRESR